MLPGFHGLDLIVILAIALLIFGPKKLPEMGAAIGKSIKEFKKGMNELTAHKEEDAPKAASLEAIEREIASKKASSVEYMAPATDAAYSARATSTTETPLE